MRSQSSRLHKTADSRISNCCSSPEAHAQQLLLIILIIEVTVSRNPLFELNFIGLVNSTVGRVWRKCEYLTKLLTEKRFRSIFGC